MSVASTLAKSVVANVAAGWGQQAVSGIADWLGGGSIAALKRTADKEVEFAKGKLAQARKAKVVRDVAAEKQAAKDDAAAAREATLQRARDAKSARDAQSEFERTSKADADALAKQDAQDARDRAAFIAAKTKEWAAMDAPPPPPHVAPPAPAPAPVQWPPLQLPPQSLPGPTTAEKAHARAVAERAKTKGLVTSTISGGAAARNGLDWLAQHGPMADEMRASKLEQQQKEQQKKEEERQKQIDEFDTKKSDQRIEREAATAAKASEKELVNKGLENVKQGLPSQATGNKGFDEWLQGHGMLIQ